MNIEDRLLQAIIPGKTLAVQVGFSRTAVMVETEDGIRCGLAATLSNPEFEHQRQPAVRHAGHLHELDYLELAGLIKSASYTEASIGLAAINALLPHKSEPWVDLNAEEYLAQNCAGKNLAIIGHFPFINRLKPLANNLWVLEKRPRDGDLPDWAAPDIIPQADLVTITATTLINKTFNNLISLCRPDARVILLGPSTPLTPILYDFGINILSGTIVNDPQNTLTGIGQGISLNQLREKNCVRLVTMKKES
jgi:uncharacterized protein